MSDRASDIYQNGSELYEEDRTALMDAQRMSSRLGALIATSHDAVIGVGFDLKVWIANPAIRKLFGLTVSDLIGSLITRIQVDEPDFWPMLRDRIQDGERSIQVEACCNVEGSPSTRVVWFSISPVVGRYGVPEGISVIARDVTESRRSQEELARSLHEKEVLLKEIHHRVKNNLQVISSLLRLQSSYLEDGQAREMFRNSEERVRCMALVHDRLCRSTDLTRVDFSRYIRELTAQMFSSYRSKLPPIELQFHLEEFELSIDRAVPCGLILSELLSNSFKYAFSGRSQGLLVIRLERKGNRIELEVADDGCGLPAEVTFDAPTTLGFRVILTLSQQLKGNAKLSRGNCTITNGTVITIDFEIETKQPIDGVKHEKD